LNALCSSTNDSRMPKRFFALNGLKTSVSTKWEFNYPRSILLGTFLLKWQLNSQQHTYGNANPRQKLNATVLNGSEKWRITDEWSCVIYFGTKVQHRLHSSNDTQSVHNKYVYCHIDPEQLVWPRKANPDESQPGQLIPQTMAWLTWLALFNKDSLSAGTRTPYERKILISQRTVVV